LGEKWLTINVISPVSLSKVEEDEITPIGKLIRKQVYVDPIGKGKAKK
jgi:hypothetical protein